MKLYFAGSENKLYRRILQDKVNRILFSAYSVKYGIVDLQFSDILCDSGGYSLRQNNETLDVSIYISFLNRNNIKLAFNLDTNNIEETLSNQKRLINETKTKIIPIYHYSDYDSKYRYLIDDFLEYDYIAVGGVAGRKLSQNELMNFLNYVFKKTRNNIRVHGLGITNIKLLKKYPFYSVDSTSWLAPVRFKNGKSKYIEYYINKDKKKLLKNEINYYLNLEKYITRLWEKRGIKWH